VAKASTSCRSGPGEVMLTASKRNQKLVSAPELCEQLGDTFLIIGEKF
jgi:hypothetical protein